MNAWTEVFKDRQRGCIGDTYQFLIEKFASGAGKKGGEFYTPEQVSVLLAKTACP